MILIFYLRMNKIVHLKLSNSRWNCRILKNLYNGLKNSYLREVGQLYCQCLICRSLPPWCLVQKLLQSSYRGYITSWKNFWQKKAAKTQGCSWFWRIFWKISLTTNLAPVQNGRSWNRWRASDVTAQPMGLWSKEIKKWLILM